MVKKEDTLSPSVPLENKKETAEEYIHKIVTPIFDKVLNENSKNVKFPQETPNNTMSVGVKDKIKPIIFYWRPNNYRMKIPFDIKKLKLDFDLTLHSKSRQGSVLDTTNGKIKISNFGTKLSCKIKGLPVMLDKNFITVTYSLRTATSPTKLEKAVYKIEAENIQDIHNRIDERVNLIKNLCIDSVKEFIKLYGGWADFDNAKWIRHEDAIHKEDWIPEETIIHDTHFKKVYPTQVEMKSPAFIKNFYSNRVIEEIAPEIAKFQSETAQNIDKLVKVISSNQNMILGLPVVLNRLEQQISSHLALIQEYRHENIKWRKAKEKEIDKNKFNNKLSKYF